ncbi:hypothetical protein [Pseudoduganella lutea]|uniref:Secreted protein n=1 Tax=Pseudoduganella lutea TaxID=321985 RepID=A0A4P6L4Q7_9BURK|nr:hypothetical protein [Pseudoduganella lutea]QBE65802.1 hypothetical protein EWM63_24830 [Pseudoduganella lutea]
MKTVTFTLALLALCGEAAARDPASGNSPGHPEIEGYVSVCAQAVPQRESAYRALLDEPLSCGARLAKGPLPARSSGQYKERFDKAALQIVRESRGDAKGTRGACEHLALACYNRHPTWSTEQKMTALQAIMVEDDERRESSP